MTNNYYYLDISLDFEEKDREVTPAFFKKYIVKAIQVIFGEVGCAIPVDLLKYNSTEKRGILRVPKEHYVKVRSSLTLVGDYEGIPCFYTVHKASPLLLSLVCDSRNFEH